MGANKIFQTEVTENRFRAERGSHDEQALKNGIQQKHGKTFSFERAPLNQDANLNNFFHTRVIHQRLAFRAPGAFTLYARPAF